MITRQKYLSSVRTVVIKLGTQLLTDPEGSLDTGFICKVARQVVALRQRGIDVTIVSSGAIGAGLRELKLSNRPTDLAKLQAVAAVGQRRLMDAWAAAFAPDGIAVAQILLTREDIDHRDRFLNLRNTVSATLGFGAVPVINENDTVSTDELIKITFGDNDILAATVTHALQAHLLVLMTVVDGVLDKHGDPVRLVENVADALAMVRTEKSALGKGGMNSKIQAAKLVTDVGQVLMVADGRMPDLLMRLLDGEELGTLFVPAEKKWSSRSRWIGSARPVGSILVDAGCAKAVGHRKSLLAAGITGTDGQFDQGDVVSVVGPDGITVAKGLTNYSSADVLRIAGKKTAEVRQLLAEAAYEEVIHCNNMVLDGKAPVRSG